MGMAVTVSFKEMMPARELVQRTSGQDWTVSTLQGRFVELTGGADSGSLSGCASIIKEAQQMGGLVAWIGTQSSIFYPPDFSAHGIDVEALPVINVPTLERAYWAADILLRAGSFKLIVLDMESMHSLPLSKQTRLSGLAQKNQTILLAMTRQQHGGIVCSSLVSLRGVSQKKRVAHNLFCLEIDIQKDKQSTGDWSHKEECCGCDGLC
jgi:hypothetical protein